MKTIEPIKSPIDYFHKIAFLANSTVQEDEHKLLFVNVDNAYCKGISELLPFSNGCFAANTSCFFSQGFETDYTFKYTENWLHVMIQIEENRCLLNIARFTVYNERIVNKDRFQFSIIDEFKLKWQQFKNTTANKIVLYISDDWLREALSFIPNMEDDNWKFLRHAIRDKIYNELPNKGSIAILVQNILNSIAQRGLTSIQHRQQGLNQLTHEIVNLILDNNYSLSEDRQKKELRGVILAQKELIKDFRTPPLSLDELAKIAGLNRQKFQKLFKAYYGNSFYQYYQEARFVYAKELIEKHGCNISEAAYMTGFKHVSYFSKYFENITGVKPNKLKHTNPKN